MLGMVFTEFVEMVEARFSPAVADAVLSKAQPTDGGYTSVGYYPHEELVAMVVELSRLVGVAVPDLVRAFGAHLLGRFTQLYPQMFERHGDMLGFVAAIDNEIHIEVRKLYPQAALPRFEVVERDARSMVLHYQSPRRMEALALGLLDGVSAHYGQPCEVQTSAPQSGEGTLFRITLID